MKARIRRLPDGDYRINIDEVGLRATASYEVEDITVDVPTIKFEYGESKPVSLKTLVLLYMAHEHRVEAEELEKISGIVIRKKE